MKGIFIVTGFDQNETEKEVRGVMKKYVNRNLTLASEDGSIAVFALKADVEAPEFGHKIEADFRLTLDGFGKGRGEVRSWQYAQGELLSAAA